MSTAGCRPGVGVRSRASRDTWHVTLGTAASYSGLLVSHTCHCHTVTRGWDTAWTQLNISCKKGTNDWFWLVISHLYLFYKTPPVELFCFMTLPYQVRFCCVKWNSNCSSTNNMRGYIDISGTSHYRYTISSYKSSLHMHTAIITLVFKCILLIFWHLVIGGWWLGLVAQLKLPGTWPTVAKVHQIN